MFSRFLVVITAILFQSHIINGFSIPKRQSGLQILEFQEPKTNVTVVLVGAMHYNPSSIQLATSTINELGQNNALGSVVVESCDIRWNKTLALYSKFPLLKKFLTNEMISSCELTIEEYNRPVILGDQRINITSKALKDSFKETIDDLTSPPEGWKRFANSVQTAWEETVPFGGEGYLNAFAFLDPKLLLVLPVSLIKYPLSFLVRDPLPTMVAFSVLFGLNYLESSSSSMDILMDTSSEVPLSDWIISLGLAVLETAVFARLLLKPLLAERNQILAKSILQQCQLNAPTSLVTTPVTQEEEEETKSKTTPFAWFESVFSKQDKSTNTSLKTSTTEIVYAPGSSDPSKSNYGEDKVVVAVLGMAHCNGIKKLLKEQLVQT